MFYPYFWGKNSNMWTEMSNIAIMAEIGSRLKEYRIRKELQQKELASMAGVGLDTVVRMERGSSITMEKLIRILRALDMLENWEDFIPKPPVSPILMKKLQGKRRMRIRSKM